MRVSVISVDEFRYRRACLNEPYDPGAVGVNAMAAIASGDGPCFAFYDSGVGFMWECPGCGHVYSGNLADQPVSGWDEPRWRKTGSDDAPTLEPSLGCSRWRDGSCPSGHWWLRDGELVAA